LLTHTAAPAVNGAGIFRLQATLAVPAILLGGVMILL
jgi:hypothetical protein